MTVKRYEFELYQCNGGEMLVSPTGGYVDYDDYLNLQRKVEALAVECAELKKFCKNASFDADYEAELSMERGGFTDALNDIETPATDAAIAEIEARGVDKAIERLIKKFEGTAPIGVPVMALEHLASELRKESGQ